MTKVMQIFKNTVYFELTNKKAPDGQTIKSAEIARTYYAPSIEIVDAPDYVFCGWSYDRTQFGDARFIKPVAPEGWEYDESNGTFWNPEQTRSSERQSLYQEYDGLESKYMARIQCNIDVEESQRKLALIVQYKIDVGNTVNQEGYPLNVQYPEKPNLD